MANSSRHAAGGVLALQPQLLDLALHAHELVGERQELRRLARRGGAGEQQQARDGEEDDEDEERGDHGDPGSRRARTA